MDWTRSEDILETAAALVGRPNSCISRKNQTRASTDNCAYRTQYTGDFASRNSPKTKEQTAAVPIVDYRDPETRALDELLEKWTGMKNPILETAREIQRIHVRDPLAAKTAAAELAAKGAHSANTISDFRGTGLIGIVGPNADAVSENLAYDSATGTFFMEKTPIPETHRLIMGLDEDKGGDLHVSETPDSLSEEELKKQGDALCEAVEWLLVSQEKDTAIEAAEAILVRARMSEVQQCVSVIGFIEDEITARSAAIALTNTQIAQLNELAERAKNISDQYDYRNPFSIRLHEDGNDDDGEEGDWDAREQYPRDNPRDNQNQHRFRQAAQPSHNYASSLAETLRGASRPILDEMYRSQQHNNNNNNNNRLAVHGQAGNPLPLGPTPPMSAAKQKMLAFALSPNSRGQQQNEHSSPASRGRLPSPSQHVTTTANIQGSSMGTPRGRDQRMPFPPTSRHSLVASADEILEAASSSAGGLTLAKMATVTPTTSRTATANVLFRGATAATRNEAEQMGHVGSNSRTESRLGAIDAKLHAKLSLVGTSD